MVKIDAKSARGVNYVLSIVIRRKIGAHLTRPVEATPGHCSNDCPALPKKDGRTAWCCVPNHDSMRGTDNVWNYVG